jgi:hypothetical protein
LICGRSGPDAGEHQSGESHVGCQTNPVRDDDRSAGISGLGNDAERGELPPLDVGVQHEFLSIRHLGFIAKGIEDIESDAVRAWTPAYENYTFTSVSGGTRLVVDQDLTADFEEFMQDTWPKAFALLKELCEDKGAT